MRKDRLVFRLVNDCVGQVLQWVQLQGKGPFGVVR